MSEDIPYKCEETKEDIIIKITMSDNQLKGIEISGIEKEAVPTILKRVAFIYERMYVEAP